MNLAEKKFFDHHTHLLDPNMVTLTKKEYVMRFLHGFQDTEPWDKGADSAYSYGYASKWQIENMANLGVVKVVTNQLAKHFGCEPTVDAVLDARNSYIGGSTEKLKEYTKSLYDSEHIIATVLDSSDPWEDTKDQVFPCKVFRLYNFENDFYELLPQASSFEALITEMMDRIRKAVSDGFAGLKGHCAENYTMDVKYISDQEAESLLPAAKRGDREAEMLVFDAMYKHVMIIAQELDVPFHIHSGTTGFNRPTARFIPNLDPFLFVPFLDADMKFLKTKVVFLHQGYPYTRHAGMMAYSYPNIFVDTSWVLPWNAFGFRTNIEDLLGVCPHDKIFFGTGQHGFPEIAWTAAKVAKACLGDVLESQVRMGLISGQQADQTANQLLFENAKWMYKMD
jgi:predicted TIM-barrel fold metal-dependent hydrolase